MNFVPSLAWKGFRRAVLSSIRRMPIHNAQPIYRQMSGSKTAIHVMWGTADRVTPFPGEEQIREAFPTATLHIVPGAGHLPHYEQPVEVRDSVLGFFQGARKLKVTGPPTHAI